MSYTHNGGGITLFLMCIGISVCWYKKWCCGKENVPARKGNIFVSMDQEEDIVASASEEEDITVAKEDREETEEVIYPGLRP